MLYSLLITAGLMGLAGLPHCTAMCAAPCAAGLPRGVPWPALLGRTLGYALLGAMAAGATAWLSQWSRWAGALQPLWVMALAASALLGAWMAATGRMPDRLQEHGLAVYRRLQALPGFAGDARQALPLFLGLAWAALPCGLIYSAVVVAMLAPSAGQGALVMAVFSLPGALVLYGLPRGLRRWQRVPAFGAPPVRAGAPILWMARAPGAAAQTSAGLGAGPASAWAWLADPRWALRSSGAMLSAASTWALAHRLHEQWLIWCA